MMNRKLRWLALAVAVMGMGISMPSCPGQQALQQQVDSLGKQNADLTKKSQALESQVHTLTEEMGQVKQLLAQMTNAIQAQKGALEQLDTSVKNMSAARASSAKTSKAKAAPKKAAAKPKHR